MYVIFRVVSKKSYRCECSKYQFTIIENEYCIEKSRGIVSFMVGLDNGGVSRTETGVCLKKMKLWLKYYI